jgi:protein-tyrosine-phosphatase
MTKLRVLFVCIGNACRSQMAEAFARLYGSDVIEPASAGLMPGIGIPPETRMVMAEKNIDLAGHLPKGIEVHDLRRFDVVVNMSGMPLPRGASAVREWKVPDPMGGTEKQHRAARDAVESLVMSLVLELRRARLKN